MSPVEIRETAYPGTWFKTYRVYYKGQQLTGLFFSRKEAEEFLT